MLKQDPKKLHIRDYSYNLPEDRIAKYPVKDRDSSKLLIYKDGEVGESVFKHLPEFLPKDTLMVFNNTKVIYARLVFHKSTGARVEVFILEPFSPSDYQVSFSSRDRVCWNCLIGNAKKWKEGALEMEVSVDGVPVILRARRVEAKGADNVVEFSWDKDVAFSEILESAGELPIPPYLNRKTEQSDLKTYQTVYSKIKGSVAAPTAGLHFTPEVLSALDKAGVQREEITLHVGAGTFKPVKSDEISGHEMHSEWISVKRSTIEALMRHDGRCTAVGTTSVRTLESLYYLGLMLHENPNLSPEELHVPQWLPYEASEKGVDSLSVMQSLQTILDYMHTNALENIVATTRILIAPGYEYHIVERMVTNFHQPQSTLLLLVSAFIGEDWHRVYDYALSHQFRFLSYGDSSLLFRKG